MQNLDFFTIRPLDGDREYAFEELCAHLARRDDRVPADSCFVRLEGAGGDGGVECYWELPGGTKWGWQSKLLSRLDKGQLTRSVQTALRIHPTLERYVVCLPFNLTGPTGRHGKDQLSRWKELVREWLQLAAKRRMQVEFELWHKSELIDRFLADDPTGGRRRFWFDEEHLGVGWFENHIDAAVADAGPRYHPELSVQVPINASFDALGQTPYWQRVWNRRLRRFDVEVERLVARSRKRRDDGKVNEATESMEACIKPIGLAQLALRRLFTEPTAHSEAREVRPDVLLRALDVLEHARAALRSELEAAHGPRAADSASFRQFEAEYQLRFPAEDYDRVEELIKELGSIQMEIYGPLADAMERRLLLVTGVAGAGKTHAVCDAARNRLARGLLSVVILGQKLVAGDVFEQIRHILGLPGDLGRDEMLVALDAAGEASHAPLILFIDALNERNPREAWQTELASMVAQVHKHRWLRLCLTCRTTYISDVTPGGLQLPSIEHRGFAGVEFEACFAFFAHWNLEPPSVPLLQPEYANPLFLRMVCTALSRANRQLPSNRFLSLGEVVTLLLETAEKEAERQIDVDRRSGVVRRGLEAVLDEMRASCTLQLTWQLTHETLEKILPGRSRSQSLLEFLLRDGLLIEVRTEGPDEPADLIRFGFERLGEYLFVGRFLEGLVEEIQLSTGGPPRLRFERLPPSNSCGIAEALAILLPERLGRELPDVDVPLSRADLLSALVNSLAWRSPESFTARTKGLVREALGTPGIFEKAMEEVLSLGVRGRHPMGALFFNDLMQGKGQPDRDAVMCLFLHRSWENGGVGRRLSEWALRPDLGPTSQDTALAWAHTLAWFCLAADRRVRDHATMGMVALMQRHSCSWPRLIERFAAVDDEYVMERILVAVYGSLVRSGDTAALAECARSIWTHVFAFGPPLNVMIRDHARCIIEMAADRGVLPSGVALSVCRPPFHSSWPADWGAESAASGEPAGRTGEEAAESEGPAMRRLRRSVQEDDFAIYTLTSALALDRRPRFNVRAAKNWILAEIARLGFEGKRFDYYDGYMMQRYGTGRGRPMWAERIGKKYQWIALYRLVGLVGDHVPLKTETWDRAPAGQVALQAPGERNLDPTLLLRRSATARRQCWWAPVEMAFRPDLTVEEWLDDRIFPDSADLIESIRPEDNRHWMTLHMHVDWSTRADEDEWSEPFRQCWMQIRSYLLRQEEHERLWRWLARQDLHGRWMPEGPSWLSYVYAGEYPWSVHARHQIMSNDFDGMTSRVPVQITPTALEQSLEFEFDTYHEGTVGLILPHPRFFEGSHLRWDGEGGYLLDSGQPAFLMPNLTKAGPVALLVDRTWLQSWLDQHRMRIVWTVLSEKHWRPGSFQRHDLGYTVHSRAHRLVAGRLQPSRGITVRQKPPGKSA